MPSSVKKNAKYTVPVTDMNNLGYGVCRIEDVVCFVAGGVTGDLLEVKIIKTASSYLVARAEKVITPSPYRTERVCPVSKRCGGCAFDGTDYGFELQTKRGIVGSAFRREGLKVKVNDVVSDGRIYGYRNKVAYPAADGKVGYYGAHTHDVVPCGGRCPLALPVIDRISGFISERIGERPTPSLRHIYVRAGEGTGEAAVCFVARSADDGFYAELADELTGKFPGIKGVLLNINPADTNVILGDEYRVLRGREYIEDVLCGLRVRVSPASFYQVNRGMAELLYRKAAEVSGLRPGESLLDLFCGTGTVGLSIAAGIPGIRLTGIEIVPEAIRNAGHNARANGIENAEFICADANAADIGSFDVIAVDPPRKGLAPELIRRIAGSGNRRLVYISCNPATLARDCKLFAEHGYELGEVYPFDLFPRTGHVETIVLLSRAWGETTE